MEFDAPREKIEQLSRLRAERAALPVDVFAELGYVPNAKQQLFHDATEYDVVYGGAKGGGKSFSLTIEGIKRCVEKDGRRVAAFRTTYPALAGSLIAALEKLQFAKVFKAKWIGTLHELRFPGRGSTGAGGSTFFFRYAQTEDDAAGYAGHEFHELLIDERTHMDPKVVEMLKECLRSGDGGTGIIGLRSSCNPGGIGHGAVKKEFIDPTENGKIVYTDPISGQTRRFIPATVYDNIKHVGTQYVKVLLAIPDKARRRAMLNGDWNAFGGQVFEDWDPGRLTVPAFAIPASWRRIAGIDYGFQNPWCVLWLALDNDDRVWLYREIYKTLVTEHEQAKMILATERAAGEHGVLHVIDPSTNAKISSALPIATTYALEGVGCMAADNDRLSGLQRVFTYLSDGPACAYHRALHELPPTDERYWRTETCPRLHVLEGTCPNFMSTMPNLPRDPHNIEDVDTDAEDHAYDAFRYGIMQIGSTARPVEALPSERSALRHEVPILPEYGPFAAEMAHGLGVPTTERVGSTMLSPFV